MRTCSLVVIVTLVLAVQSAEVAEGEVELVQPLAALGAAPSTDMGANV